MTTEGAQRALSALRRFAAREGTGPRCDLCSAPLGDAHAHLFEPEPRRVACACAACALLFSDATAGRYRRLHSRATRVPSATLMEDDFRDLELPVRLAFLSPSAVHDQVFAVYPNAAGATESVVPRPAWRALLARTPALAAMTEDTEGLLIDHLGGRSRCFVASLDVCYEFVGLLREPSSRRGAAFATAMRFLDGLDGGRRG
ncbi:MAG TPA: DUF5947 family protein [Polyangiaceae bacterium]|nr:DUF5947 family protein [Polyangiaceae bacterium]